jgi:ABC-type multidrug transport system fused ATPase/permease subunit
VGSTIVVGRLTDELIQPAFRGHVERRSILLGVAAVIADARGVSVVVRRYFAAMLEARMQVTLRTGVVDKYLSVPMAFHQSRPTGELLARRGRRVGHHDADRRCPSRSG